MAAGGGQLARSAQPDRRKTAQPAGPARWGTGRLWINVSSGDARPACWFC
jgi:hypothetical protein